MFSTLVWAVGGVVRRRAGGLRSAGVGGWGGQDGAGTCATTLMWVGGFKLDALHLGGMDGAEESGGVDADGAVLGEWRVLVRCRGGRSGVVGREGVSLAAVD